jgi:hypothetical protein
MSLNTIADTGSTCDFLRSDTFASDPSISDTPNITISLPNGTQIQSVSRTQLQIPIIPQSARTAYLFPQIRTNSLLSVGQLCDAGCTTTFDNNTVKIWFGTELLLEDTRNHDTKLWTVPIQVTTASDHNAPDPTDLPSSWHIINQVQKVDQLVAAMFAPSITTLIRAIQKDFLVGLPGLTVNNLRAYPPVTTATAKGHLDQNRQNKQSTPKVPDVLPLITTMDTTPPEPP